MTYFGDAPARTRASSSKEGSVRLSEKTAFALQRLFREKPDEKTPTKKKSEKKKKCFRLKDSKGSIKTCPTASQCRFCLPWKRRSQECDGPRRDTEALPDYSGKNPSNEAKPNASNAPETKALWKAKTRLCERTSTSETPLSATGDKPANMSGWEAKGGPVVDVSLLSSLCLSLSLSLYSPLSL